MMRLAASILARCCCYRASAVQMSLHKTLLFELVGNHTSLTLQLPLGITI
jgi:hypothetical protein